MALLVRTRYAFGAEPVLYPGTDNTWYLTVARSVASGEWGRIVGVAGERVWSFRFPPGYPWLLAAGEHVLFWVDRVDAARWTSVAAGTVATVVVARIAWRWTAAAPPRARVIATAVAGLVLALGPIAAGASAALMSESLFVPLVAGVLLAVDRLLTPGASRAWAVLLGALLVVGALTRVEGIVYLGAPVVAALVLARRRSLPLGRLVGGLAVAACAVVGWSVFASAESGRPVAVAANGGPLLGANCHAAQWGEAAGYWLSGCLAVPQHRLSAHTRSVQALSTRPRFGIVTPSGPEAEADVSAAQHDLALERIVDRPLDVLHAIPFRIARAAGVYWTPTQEDHETFEGRDRDWEAAGRWFHLVVVLPLVLVALVALAARRSEVGRRLRVVVDPSRLAPAIALLGVWVVVTAATYGSARLRAPVEPVLALLAGLGATLVSTRNR